ncbi:MAG TPA: CHRD domain-containing protein [Opitutaceae bacterium]|nr:CHRD domain-containing protein [Opitutaceae bacterium]
MKKLFALLLVFSLPLISSAQVLVFHANLTGAQEVPANASPGTGFADAILDVPTSVLTFSTTWSGLLAATSNGHIHTAPVGVSGPVVIPFPGLTLGSTFGTYSNTFTLTAGQVSDLVAGLDYVNIHSTSFPGGEIRGQLLAVPGAVPEPSTYALGGAAILAWLAVRRIRSGRRAARST